MLLIVRFDRGFGVYGRTISRGVSVGAIAASASTEQQCAGRRGVAKTWSLAHVTHRRRDED